MVAPVTAAGDVPIAGVGPAMDAGRTALDGRVASAGPEVLHVAGGPTDVVCHSAGAIGAGSPD